MKKQRGERNKNELANLNIVNHVHRRWEDCEIAFIDNIVIIILITIIFIIVIIINDNIT